MTDYQLPETTRDTAFPIARAGYAIIFGAAFVTFVFALLGLTALSIPALIATLFICFFFRDPDRVVPRGKGMVVSPADGKVIAVDQVDKAPCMDTPCTKISIFMTIFNVHVNRIPHEGTVKHIVYHPGKFFSANLDKASAENEHNVMLIETDSGYQYVFVQIAGLVARRIICTLQPGDTVRRGGRFGMICFGSRLDVYLPTGFTTVVGVGDKVNAGSTVLGTLPG